MMTAGTFPKVHPVAELFPLIHGAEFDALVQSIRNEGLEHPVMLAPDGTLLDGRNRLRACHEAGVKPRYKTYKGSDPAAFIIRVNIHRRHLTTGQRSFLALETLAFYEQEAAKRQAQAKGRSRGTKQASVMADLPEQSAGNARDQAAATVGVSGRAVQQAKRLAKDAPDLADEVRSGQLTLDAADRQLTRRLSNQQERDTRLITLDSTVADAEGGTWKMLHGDFRDRLADLGDESVDAIVTDPPYAAEFLPLWSDVAKHAARLLKPQGLLMGLTGQIFLPEVLERLGEHLQYGWVYAQTMCGPNSRIMGRHVYQSWKPWVVHSKGAWPSGSIDWHSDSVVSSAPAKEFRWQQDADTAAYLVERLTTPGALIVDPLAGHGTYGCAAVAGGRHFIGVEADAGRFAKAVEALEDQDEG